MTLKNNTIHPFDYLETQEEINEYLNDAFQDDDPRLFIIAYYFILI